MWTCESASDSASPGLSSSWTVDPSHQPSIDDAYVLMDRDGEDYNGSLRVDIFESSSAANHSEPGDVVAGDGTISQDTNKAYSEECDDSVFGRAVCDSRHRDALMSAEGLSGNVRNEIKTGPRGNITFNLRPLTASAYQSVLASRVSN